ncbi:transglycosylase domain-containing protein [Mollicutes bacterium LVI A0078]|nr:transglycosylase domain-containing protein [Mollicutes bacterium LVI A0075]WOO90635.1 transglycosylase domain-containing protein [Mollicutes bacterium LVI A0078]
MDSNKTTTKSRRKAQDTKAKSNATKTNKATTNKKATNSQDKWKKVLINTLILLVFFIVVAYISATVIFNSLKANTLEITDNNFWQNQSTALVYNSSGDQIGKLSERDVKWTELCRDAKEGEELTEDNTLFLCEDGQVAKVSPYYIEGLVATEDQGFMDHNGVNFKGMIRVTLAALVNQDASAGGGSSITMQLAKLLYLQPVSMYDGPGEKLSWTRNDQSISSYAISEENPIQYKLSQMALALKIEDKYTKTEIMENYVNTMWFGAGGYGINNAAEYYYGVSPAELTIAQSATLAGMTQRPVDWNPYTNPEDTTTRRNTVISRLEAEGYITSEEAEEAKALDIQADLVDHSNDDEAEESRLKYYNDINLYVLDELEGLLGENADINTGGMKIHTTVDDQLQKATIDTLDTENGLIGWPILEGTQTGTAMIDVENGGILALGNGFDGESPYAYSYNELRNPGSTAKPLTAYAPAIEYLGWSTLHTLNDKTTYYSGTTTEVGNYSGKHIGNVSMMKALSMSLNTTAVQAFQEVVDEIGIEEMTSWFERVGLYDWEIGRTEENPQVYESYTLGAFGSTPVEMASAFATFANGGVYNEPHIIEYIEFDEQSPYYDVYGSKWYPEYDSHKAMEPSTAYLITKMLNPDNEGAFTGSADVPELDNAIKTGTSNWGDNNFGIPASYARDRWTIGYTPDIATAVWYGYQYEYERDGYMFYEQPEQPLYIWHALMSNTITTDDPTLSDGEFVMPDNVYTKVVNGVTHYFVEGEEGEEDLNIAPSAPQMNVSLSEANKVSVSWSETSGASEYNVLVNDTVVDTTSGTSSTLTYDQLFEVACSSSYTIGVQSVSSSGVTSGVSSYSISNDTSNCDDSKEKEEEEAAKKAEEEEAAKKAEEEEAAKKAEEEEAAKKAEEEKAAAEE